MTCRSGVVSVAIVVRTARTTASVLTPEPNTLRARTGWSGRVLYARVGARVGARVLGARRVRLCEVRVTCGVYAVWWVVRRMVCVPRRKKVVC